MAPCLASTSSPWPEYSNVRAATTNYTLFPSANAAGMTTDSL